MGPNPIIGVVICSCGNLVISLALNVQKLAHKRLEGNHKEQDETSRLISPQNSSVEDGHTPGAATQSKEYLHSKLWWLGILLMALGEGGNFAGYGFAPASLIAPLGVVALVANCFVAPAMLKEKFATKDLWGVVLAIAGVIVVVLSSNSRQEPLDPDHFKYLLTQWPCILFLCLTLPALFLLAFLSRGRHADRYIMIDIGVCSLSGAYTVLSTKSLSSFLSSRGLDIFRLPITYAILVILIGSAVLQVNFLNKALQRFDSREVVPTNFVAFTISAIVASSLVFGDFRYAQAHQVVLFALGCCCVFLGVKLLTQYGSHHGRKYRS